ncbi:histone-lysine N-methyltransferase SETMAR-like [Melitaea cinxia]|uniref:histone-lysine N-methyltransferase SETMAR-like n=1 Tax=Melitaea cinxia TaxID=113334 RepID=UPI001E270809|nr:histone-lysine N-methyltransferase SETMAR-like [Melitaea cinxia]
MSRTSTNAAETARRFNNVNGCSVAKENTLSFWFQRFRSGNFDLQNKPRGRPETKVDNEELKAIVEADLSQTMSESAAGCGVNNKTVLIYLKQIGKTITADVFRQQLQTMMEKLAAKQPRLVNHSRPLLLQDNARP